MSYESSSKCSDKSDKIEEEQGLPVVTTFYHYSDPTHAPNSLLQVVAIHGGAFMYGGPLVYTDWEYMAKRYASDAKIILVTIQYRLGAFGNRTNCSITFIETLI